VAASCGYFTYRWNYAETALGSDVDAVQLVARKTGVTTNIEHVLVDAIDIDTCFEADPGKSLQLHSAASHQSATLVLPCLDIRQTSDGV